MDGDERGHWIREWSDGPHPARFEEADGGGWVLQLGGGRMCIERCAGGWAAPVDDGRVWTTPVMVSAASPGDAERILEFMVEKALGFLLDPPRVTAPLRPWAASLSLMFDAPDASGRRTRRYNLYIRVPGNVVMMSIDRRDDDADVTFTHVQARHAFILFRDGWPDRTRATDRLLASDEPLFAGGWHSLGMPGEPFGVGPEGVVWTMRHLDGGTTRVARGPWDAGAVDQFDVRGLHANGVVLPGGSSGLIVVTAPGLDGDEVGPVELVRIDAGTGVRWRTRVGRGAPEDADGWNIHVAPGGERVVADVERHAAVVRLADGAIEDRRWVAQRHVRGWTPEGILLSDGSPRAQLWSPPEPPRGAILPGRNISPSGRWRFDYDEGEDRMTAWSTDGDHRVIEGVRGPYDDVPFFPFGWIRDDVVWMDSWSHQSVLVSLASGALHPAISDQASDRDIHLVTPRMVFSPSRDAWVVMHAQMDPSELFAAHSR